MSRIENTDSSNVADQATEAAHDVASTVGAVSHGAHATGFHLPGPLHKLEAVSHVVAAALSDHKTGNSVEDTVCGAISGGAEFLASAAVGFVVVETAAVLAPVTVPGAVVGGSVAAQTLKSGVLGAAFHDTISRVTKPVGDGVNQVCHATFSALRTVSIDDSSDHADHVIGGVLTTLPSLDLIIDGALATLPCLGLLTGVLLLENGLMLLRKNKATSATNAETKSEPVVIWKWKTSAGEGQLDYSPYDLADSAHLIKKVIVVGVTHEPTFGEATAEVIEKVVRSEIAFSNVITQNPGAFIVCEGYTNNWSGPTYNHHTIHDYLARGAFPTGIPTSYELLIPRGEYDSIALDQTEILYRRGAERIKLSLMEIPRFYRSARPEFQKKHWQRLEAAEQQYTEARSEWKIINSLLHYEKRPKKIIQLEQRRRALEHLIKKHNWSAEGSDLNIEVMCVREVETILCMNEALRNDANGKPATVIIKFGRAHLENFKAHFEELNIACETVDTAVEKSIPATAVFDNDTFVMRPEDLVESSKPSNAAKKSVNVLCGEVIPESYDRVSKLFDEQQKPIHIDYGFVKTNTNNLVVFITNMVAGDDSVEFNDSTKTTGTFFQLIDELRNLAKEKQANKLFIQFWAFNPRLEQVFMRRHTFRGDHPFTLAECSSFLSDGDLEVMPSELPIFEVDLKKPANNFIEITASAEALHRSTVVPIQSGPKLLGTVASAQKSLPAQTSATLEIAKPSSTHEKTAIAARENLSSRQSFEFVVEPEYSNVPYSKEHILEWQKTEYVNSRHELRQHIFDLENRIMSATQREKIISRVIELHDFGLEMKRFNAEKPTHFFDRHFLNEKLYPNTESIFSTEGLHIPGQQKVSAALKNMGIGLANLALGLMPAIAAEGAARVTEWFCKAHEVGEVATDSAKAASATAATGLVAIALRFTPQGRYTYMAIVGTAHVADMLDKYERLLMDPALPSSHPQNAAISATAALGQMFNDVFRVSFAAIIGAAKGVGTWSENLGTWVTDRDHPDLTAQIVYGAIHNAREPFKHFLLNAEKFFISLWNICKHTLDFGDGYPHFYRGEYILAKPSKPIATSKKSEPLEDDADFLEMLEAERTFASYSSARPVTRFTNTSVPAFSANAPAVLTPAFFAHVPSSIDLPRNPDRTHATTPLRSLSMYAASANGVSRSSITESSSGNSAASARFASGVSEANQFGTAGGDQASSAASGQRRTLMIGFAADAGRDGVKIDGVEHWGPWKRM